MTAFDETSSSIEQRAERPSSRARTGLLHGILDALHHSRRLQAEAILRRYRSLGVIDDADSGGDTTGMAGAKAPTRPDRDRSAAIDPVVIACICLILALHLTAASVIRDGVGAGENRDRTARLIASD